MKTAYGLRVSIWRWIKYYLFGMKDLEINLHSLNGLRGEHK